ncbi:MAG: class I SAM-dependent methyltransferase [Gemmatimonadaceae bacterium]|nr:class I SAM-dependent methyltransferase [Gemmatimonadaceae bacterium]
MTPRMIVVYQDSPRLAYREQSRRNLEFVTQRIEHFFRDTNVRFLPDGVPLDAQASDVVVGVTLLNPLLDIDLLRTMIDWAGRVPRRIVAEGAVPGTEPQYVALAGHTQSATKVIFHDTQRQYNTQLNLYRMKRAKIFNSFCAAFPDFHSWSTRRLLDYCATPEGVRFVLSYGEPIELTEYRACPLCQSEHLLALHADNGHPVQGFLNRHSVFYHRCQQCELVFLNPHAGHKDLHRYYDEYTFESPLRSHSFDHLFDHLGEETVSHWANYVSIAGLIDSLPRGGRCLDIGGGYGEFCQFVARRRPDLRVELLDFRIDDELQAALRQRNIEARSGDFVTEDLGEGAFELITNWEVIEHIDLTYLKPYFRKVHRALTPTGRYVFSTPDFADPFCRALDFWAMAPGEHLSVLSRAVLEPILESVGLVVLHESHESVTTKTADRWFKYAAEHHASLAARAEGWIINDLLQQESLSDYRRSVRQRNLGSELILTVGKP